MVNVDNGGNELDVHVPNVGGREWERAPCGLEDAEEGREAMGLKSPIIVTEEEREKHGRTHTHRTSIEAGASTVCGRDRGTFPQSKTSS